jgi:hypothetical protein
VGEIFLPNIVLSSLFFENHYPITSEPGRSIMRREIIVLLVGVVVCLGTVVKAAEYGGGSGTEEYPYQIGSADDIIEMYNDPNNWDKQFLMIADVNMIDYTFAASVIAPDRDRTNYSFEGSSFTGIFDGAGHVILNLTIDTAGVGNDYLGLFGQISGEEAEVKNLSLENVFVIGNGVFSNYLGGLCGYNDVGTISNCYIRSFVAEGAYLGGLCGGNSGSISDCYSTGTVSGGGDSAYLGGLCGRNDGTISNCYSIGSVSGGQLSWCLGGLCGRNFGTIIDCYATGSVSGGDGSQYLGGLCGYNYSGWISNCYAIDSVIGGDNSEELGGLCGCNGGTISNCYSEGSVSGGDNYRYLGGLSGRNDSSGIISNCCATGGVSGGDDSYYLGGLCGRNRNTISNCYAAGSISGGLVSEYLGGLCGYNDYDSGIISDCFWDIDTSGMTDSDGGTGLPTEDMHKIITFTNAGWDFVGEDVNGTNDIWRMCVDGIEYPYLSWEYSVNGDFDCPDGIEIGDLISLSYNWLNSEEHDPDFSYACDPTFDGVTNLLDLAILSEHWLEED